MRRVVLFVALAMPAFGSTSEAQAPTDPNTFPTMEACTEALRTGHLRFYEPRFFGLTTKDPVDNRERFIVPLEADLCLEMLVVGGRRFVAQREGTMFRARRLGDGSLYLYARDDCGNPVYGVVFPAPPVAAPEPTPPHPELVGPPVRESINVTRVVIHEQPKKKGGFCSSTKCKLAFIAVGGAAAGYAVWRFWPCPPGTVHR